MSACQQLLCHYHHFLQHCRRQELLPTWRLLCKGRSVLLLDGTAEETLLQAKHDSHSTLRVDSNRVQIHLQLYLLFQLKFWNFHQLLRKKIKISGNLTTSGLELDFFPCINQKMQYASRELRCWFSSSVITQNCHNQFCYCFLFTSLKAEVKFRIPVTKLEHESLEDYGLSNIKTYCFACNVSCL